MRDFLKKIFHKRSSHIKTPIIDSWTNSSNYWENRYVSGGNSGIGSYGRLAQFKADVINQFVRENNIQKIIEWGCGDGNQLSLAAYPQYIGFDVSKEAIAICQKKFIGDKAKQFIYCGSDNFSTKHTAELTLSLDVLYHLIEDEVYETYMRRLFETSTRYVCIYSCNDEKTTNAQHVKHRKFTDWIDIYAKEWRMIRIIKNRYPYSPDVPESSWSDFYFYEKQNYNKNNEKVPS